MTAATLARPVCLGKPAEWWDTGDDGNRLALGLCDVCPARRGDTCRAGTPDPQPHGVIRAGIAYSDTGRRLPICGCGYPQTNYLGGVVSDCPRCLTPDVPIPDPRRALRLQIKHLHRDGFSDTQISAVVRRSPSTVSHIRSAEGWTRTRGQTHAAWSRADREVA